MLIIITPEGRGFTSKRFADVPRDFGSPKLPLSGGHADSNYLLIIRVYAPNARKTFAVVSLIDSQHSFLCYVATHLKELKKHT